MVGKNGVGRYHLLRQGYRYSLVEMGSATHLKQNSNVPKYVPTVPMYLLYQLSAIALLVSLPPLSGVCLLGTTLPTYDYIIFRVCLVPSEKKRMRV